MTKFEYFMSVYGELPRAGPGDKDSTREAFQHVEGLPRNSRILDIGCGPAVQTVDLAGMTKGRIVAIDLYPSMISRAALALEKAGLSRQVDLVQMDMQELAFADNSFDLVWSEGSIYIIGFRKGLNYLKRFLKPGGFVAISDAIWTRPDSPEELKEFWAEYPEMDSVDSKLAVIGDCGFELLGHFILPSASWVDQYYGPLEEKLNEMEPQWKDIPEAMEVIREARHELKMFEKYSDYYSYGFFVMGR